MMVWTIEGTNEYCLEPTSQPLVKQVEHNCAFYTVVGSSYTSRQFYYFRSMIDPNLTFKGVTLSAKVADEVYQSYLAHQI